MKKFWQHSASKPILALGLILLVAAFLRFYKLGEIPRGLAWDEASITYNAWAVALWHRDEFAEFMPLAFRSFGDYKPPFLIYALAAGFWTFGLQLWMLRAYSAVAGVGIVLFTYLITRELSKDKILPFVSSLLVALSPWAIHFSRLGFEQNLTVLLMMAGIWFFLKGLSRPRYWLGSSVCFAASLYTFHTAKIFVPVFLVFMAVLYGKKLWRLWGGAAVGLLMALLVPLAMATIYGQAGARAETLIFFRGAPLEVLAEFGANILHQLSPAFWLEGWDAVSIRHGVPGHGVMYVTPFLFMIVALWLAVTKRSKELLFLAAWWVAGLAPAIVSHITPHALRSLMVVGSAEILAAYAMVWGARKLYRSQLWWWGGIGLSVTISLVLYLTAYYGDYAASSARSFQYGYKEAIEIAAELGRTSERVMITDAYGQPYVYVLLYRQMKPVDWLAGGLADYTFGRIEWNKRVPKRVYVGTPEEIPVNDPTVVKTIVIPNTDQVVLVVAKT